jgi:hypothetical protein
MSEHHESRFHPLYEPPRLEATAAFRGPRSRSSVGPGTASWNIVCSECASGGGQ